MEKDTELRAEAYEQLQAENEQLKAQLQQLKNKPASERATQLYKSLYENVHVPYAVWELVFDEDGQPMDFCYKEVNQAYLEWIGKTREDVIGANAYDVFPHYRSESDWFARMVEVATTGKPQVTRQASFLYDRWLHINMHRPRPHEVAMLVMDITKEKTAVNESQRFSTRLNLALEIEKIALWEWVIPTDVVENYNEYWKALYQFENKDTSKQFYDRIFPEDAAPAQQALENHMAGQTDDFFQVYRLRNKTGDGFKWIRNRGKVVESDAEGLPVRIVGVSTDITQQREREIKLEQRAFEQKYAQELSKMGNWYYDIKTGSVEWTEQVYRIFGLDPSGPPVPFADQRRYFKASSWEKLTAAAQLAMEEGVSYDLELEVIPEDQHKSRWLRSIGVAVLDADGKVVGLRGVAQDITEDKEREEKLKRATLELNSAQSLSKIGSWYLDVATNEVSWTEEIYRMYGFDPSLPPPPYTEHMKLFTEESWNLLSEKLQLTATEGIPYDLELEMATEHASFGWMRAMGEAVKDKTGKIIGLRGVAQDITEIKGINDKLQQEKKYAETVMESSAAGIYIFDIQQRKNIYANKQTGEVLGFTPAELKAMPSEQFVGRFHPDDLPEIFEHFERVNTKLETCKIKYRFKHKEGHYVTCIGVDSPYEFDNDGKLKSYIGSFIDISELQQKEEELIVARNEAIRANQQKDLFLSNLSHEIRTPMNAVVGFSKLLRKGGRSQEEKDIYLEQIEMNSKQLLVLIDDILDVSKIETGSINLHEEPFSLKKLVLEISKYYHSLLTGTSQLVKQLELVVEYPEDIDQDHDLITADPVRVKQILTNLLDNAIKYSKQGVITLSYEVNANGVIFSVKDQGIGIPAENLKHIFDRFSQAASSTKYTEGVGLGLSIVKGLLTIMGGEIEVYSEVGVGSEFRCMIPLVPTRPASVQTDVTNVSVVEQQGIKKLLLVDDTEAIHLYVSSLLSDTAIEIIHAYDGQSAVHLYKEHPDIELILMDLKMPIMTGEEAFYEIRSFDTEVPIIAQSAFAMNDEIQRYKQIGFTDYLTKPVDELKLKKILNLISK